MIADVKCFSLTSFFFSIYYRNDNHQNIIDFLLTLSLCHTVVTEKEGDGIKYQAQSPDEAALVNAAASLGFKYTGILDGFQVLEVGSRTYRFKLHAVNDFDSTRKRQSSLVEDDNGNYVLYIKGADNVILDRMAPLQNTTVLNGHIVEFAKVGLRTLLLAKKLIPKEEALDWLVKYREALNSLDNRDEKLARVAEVLESNLKV